MSCTSCGASHAPDAAFCSRCGTALHPAPGAAGAPGVAAPGWVPPAGPAPHGPYSAYPYVPPGYTGAWAPTDPGTNGLSIASLVLGIVWVYGLGSLLALVFGLVGLSQVRRTGQRGRGMAIAGVVLGAIGLAFTALALLVAITADPYDY